MRRIEVRPRRLRSGELIAGASGLALLVFLFAFTWYGAKAPVGRTAAILGTVPSVSGWHGLTEVRWLILITAVGALALFAAQMALRGPAIPVCLSVILTVLGVINVLVLIDRVLLNLPGPSDLVDAKAGAYLGLGAAVAVMYGAYASMRREGILDDDGPGEVPLIATTPAAPPAETGTPDAVSLGPGA